MPADGSAMHAVHSEPTRAEEGADAVTARIVRLVEATIAQTMQECGITRGDFAGVGIGAPGPLDRATGVVLITPNLGWTNYPLRDRVSDALGLPAALDNDANCATLG